MSSLLESDKMPRANHHMYFLIIVLLGVCTAQLFGDDTIKAYTVDGKGVLLHEDGSWEYTGKIGFFDIERNGIASVDEIVIADLLPGSLIGVIDGDTIKVVFVDPPPGIQTEESIRLLGIDAPELNASTGSGPLATEAREFVVEHTADSTVYLAFESRWRGDFGRLLAYVFTSEGSLLNAELLSCGLASVYNKEPCHFHESPWRMLHHLPFCCLTKCPNYRIMNDIYRKINREKLREEILEEELKDGRRKMVLDGFKKMLKVRSENPDFGPYVGEEVLDSDKRLLVLKKETGLVVVINVSSEAVKLNEFEGREDLMSGEGFGGVVGGYGVCVLK